MKKAAVLLLAILVLMLSACRANFLDDDLAQILTDSLYDLSVTVWGDYDFTAHYMSIPGGGIDIPVTVIDEKGFESLADSPQEQEYTMLVVSGEIVNDDLLIPERIDYFNALLDQGMVICFLTDSETMANRIAIAITGNEWEHSADGSKAHQYTLGIFKVMEGDPILTGSEPGDAVLCGISSTDSVIPQSELDALILRQAVDRYRLRSLSGG